MDNNITSLSIARVFLVASCVSLSACHPHEQSRDHAVTLQANSDMTDFVVARVNGRPITFADLRLQVSNGESIDEALDSLIAVELLVLAAEQRGFAELEPVKRIQQRALAQTFIKREFGNNMTKESIPFELLQKAFQENLIRYQRPEMVSVVHIIVHSPQKETAQHHHRASAVADELRQKAIERHVDENAFRHLVDDYQHREEGLAVASESLRTPLRGFTVPEFADAAFALKRKGDISPVIKTTFGYHVIFFIERIPPIHREFKEVIDELRTQSFVPARKYLFEKFVRTYEEKHQIDIDREGIESMLRYEQS